MNRISTASTRSGRQKPALAICAGIVFGAVCFFAGRISVQPTYSKVDPNAANYAVGVPTNAGGSADVTVATAVGRTEGESASKPPWKWDEQKWNELMSKPGTVARNKALAEMLEKLAATDPKRAMALAQAEGNLKLRADLKQAALSGWASTAPKDASDWALALTTPSDRSAAMKTVFASAAAADPDGAVRVANLMMQQGVDGIQGYGSSLIDALCAAGNFETAAKFAAGGDSGQSRGWLGEMYSQWAGLQPEEAAQAALAITDPDIQNGALHGVIGGWAQADPAALTQFLTQVPPGGDRGQMLGQALQNWVRLDPVAAANWINNSDMGADLDQGIQAVASMNLSEDNFKPDVAIGWVESINDDTLRSEALVNVLRNWIYIDLPAATGYFNQTTDLSPAGRQQIGEMIADLSRNVAQ
jgi:hypothetical protein